MQSESNEDMDSCMEDRLKAILAKQTSELTLLFGEMMNSKKAEWKAEFKVEVKTEVKTELEAELRPKLKTEILAELWQAEGTRSAASQDATSDRITQLEGAFEVKERATRSANLLLHGLQEAEHKDTSALVTGLFDSNSGPTVAVTEARRLGAPRATPARPRPFLIHFPSVAAKHAALKHCKALRQRKLFLDPDLTRQQQQIRVGLRPRYIAAKTEGKKPFWREERLYIRDGDRVTECCPVPPPPPRTHATAAGPSSSGAGPSSRPPTSFADAVRR